LVEPDPLGLNFGSGLQPSDFLLGLYLGLRPRLVYGTPSARLERSAEASLILRR